MQKRNFWVERCLVSPRSTSERALECYVEPGKACSKDELVMEAPCNCDLCGIPFESRNFWIDAKFKDCLLWGNMCSDCFMLRGDGISWGKGQLYARTRSGEWLMVAGFPPEGLEADI